MFNFKIEMYLKVISSFTWNTNYHYPLLVILDKPRVIIYSDLVQIILYYFINYVFCCSFQGVIGNFI